MCLKWANTGAGGLFSPTCQLKRHELLTVSMIGPENPQALPPADDGPPASRAARQRAAPAGHSRPRQQARRMEEAIEPPLARGGRAIFLYVSLLFGHRRKSAPKSILRRKRLFWRNVLRVCYAHIWQSQVHIINLKFARTILRFGYGDTAWGYSTYPPRPHSAVALGCHV